MPVKTVTLQVSALTDAANRQILATSAYFEKLRQANPVELSVRFDRLQAIAQSKIIAKEMSQAVTDTVRLQADRGGGIGGVFSQLGGGISGGLTGAASALPGIGQALAANPQAAAGGIVAALAALPFIAQAAAGGIVTALGGGLAAIGVYSAPKTTQVKKDFASLKTAAIKDFGGIGTPFNSAVSSILRDAKTFLPDIAAAFAGGLKPIATPLRDFGIMLEAVFADPKVAASIKAVGTAFGSILRAVTPLLPGMIDSIAGGIKKIADAVAKNPKPFADFVDFLAHVAGFALNVIAWLTNVASYIEKHFVPVFRGVSTALANWRENEIQFFVKWGHDIEHNFDNIVTFVTGWPRRVISAVSALPGMLSSFATRAMGSFLDGVKRVWHDVEGWFAGLPSMILHALGIKSPPDWAISAGSHIMGGLLKGIAHGAGDVRGFFTGLASNLLGPLKDVWKGITGFFTGHGNVVSWITAALQATGTPISWMTGLETLIGRESGGNPNAVNPVTVMGEHASGLYQMLPSTYAAFATVAGGLFNPIAEGVAAIRYIKSVYGSVYNIPNLFSGNYRGYAYGTLSAAPGWAWVGERGAELVRFRGGEQVAPHRGARGAAASVNITVGGTPRNEADAFLVSWLKRLIANGHLNVQMAP